MLRISVKKDGSGDFATVTEAVQSVPYDTPATVLIGAGVFVEKIFVEKRDIRLWGSGMDKTVLRWADGAYHLHGDGTPTGTFRSYTAFLGGGRVEVKDMTIENAAGDGAGQGIAAYADAALVRMENVALTGCQDTLFCAPLPQRERQPRGFYGPRALTPRLMTRQLYRRSHIAGDIDFVFGGADAVFEGCTLISRNCGSGRTGYVAAPSGPSDGLGFVFVDCAFEGECTPGTVYLARPWREYGKAVLLRCTLDGHIHPQGWSPWAGESAAPHAYFAEYDCSGEGAFSGARVPWAHALTAAEAAAWLERAKALADSVTGVPLEGPCPCATDS